MANVMGSILITIEDEQIKENNKKGGGTYSTQRAFFHEVERDGSPKRFPREITVFPQKLNGVVQPYKKGHYTLAPQSLNVDARGFLELGYVSLLPVKAAV